MLPKYHFLAGLAVFIFLIIVGVPFFNATLFLLSSVLIDIDHYFYYVWKKKDPNLFKAYKWHIKVSRELKGMRKRKKYKRTVLVFHGIEFLLFLLILSVFFPTFIWIFFGSIFHLLLDLTELFLLQEPLHTKIFPTGVIIKNKNKQDLKYLKLE